MKKISLVVLFVFVSITVYAAEIVRIAPLTISIANNTTTITTSATAIPGTSLVGRETIAICLNDTTDTVYIGNSSVSTANGLPLDSSRPCLNVDADDSIIFYGIVSAGTADVRSLEIK